VKAFIIFSVSGTKLGCILNDSVGKEVVVFVVSFLLSAIVCSCVNLVLLSVDVVAVVVVSVVVVLIISRKVLFSASLKEEVSFNELFNGDITFILAKDDDGDSLDNLMISVSFRVILIGNIKLFATELVAADFEP